MLISLGDGNAECFGFATTTVTTTTSVTQTHHDVYDVSPLSQTHERIHSVSTCWVQKQNYGWNKNTQIRCLMARAFSFHDCFSAETGHFSAGWRLCSAGWRLCGANG
jgi:hypothetical protein